MVDLVAEIEALFAHGPHGRREAEIRIAAAKHPLDERMWLLGAVAGAQQPGTTGLRQTSQRGHACD